MEINVGTPPSPEKNHMSDLEATAVARAARLGKTVDQLLVDDRHSLRTSTYPTADCFRPHEVEQYARGDLSEARMQHGESCQACAALLVSAQSWERPLDVFLDEVRDHKPALVADDVRAPLTDALFAGGPIAALGLFIVVIAYKWDAIMSISFAPLGWTPVVTLLATTALTVAAIPLGFVAAKGLGLQVSFARFGGAAIAGVFVLVFAGYGASAIWTVSSNYQLVQSAEDRALGIVAVRIRNGSNDSEAVKVPAFTRTLAGSIVAEPRKDSISEVRRAGASTQRVSEAFEIYWDQKQLTSNWDQGERTSIGTVYVGHMEQRPDGKYTVKTSKQTIGVNVSPAQLSRVKGNEPVFAVVPVNAQEASRVLSVGDLVEQAAGVAPAGR